MRQNQGIEWMAPQQIGGSMSNVGNYSLAPPNPRMGQIPQIQSFSGTPQQFSGTVSPHYNIGGSPAAVSQQILQQPFPMSNDALYQQQLAQMPVTNSTMGHMGTMQQQNNAAFLMDKRLISAIQEEDFQAQTVDAVNRTLSKWEQAQYPKAKVEHSKLEDKQDQENCNSTLPAQVREIIFV